MHGADVALPACVSHGSRVPPENDMLCVMPVCTSFVHAYDYSVKGDMWLRLACIALWVDVFTYIDPELRMRVCISR